MHMTTTTTPALPADLRVELRAANRHIAEHGAPADDQAWDDLNDRIVAAVGAEAALDLLTA